MGWAVVGAAKGEAAQRETFPLRLANPSIVFICILMISSIKVNKKFLLSPPPQSQPTSMNSQSPSKPSFTSPDPPMETAPIPSLTPKPSPKRKSRSSKILPFKDSLNQSPTPRRKPKTRAPTAASTAASTAALPRKPRKPRRRPEKEIAVIDEDEVVAVDDDVVARPRKKRQKSKQRQPDSIALNPSPSSCTLKIDGNDGTNVMEAISELVMWKNVAKSALWFGSGSMFILPSCFSTDSNFSIISAASHLGILVLGVAFFRDSMPQRQQEKPKVTKFQLTEEDFLRAARLVLPTANAVLAKCQKIFSGEPSMTLKVAPVLLFTAKYGHLITLQRLLATGFFLSFTLPKLYSSYAEQIHKRVKEAKSYVKEAWKSCPCKKLVAASTAMLFWNLSSIKMRIFTAFMSLVVLRHKKRQRGVSNEIERGEERQQQVMLLEL